MKKATIIALVGIFLLGNGSYSEAAPNISSIVKGIGKIFSKKPSAQQTRVLVGGAAAGQAIKKDDKKNRK